LDLFGSLDYVVVLPFSSARSSYSSSKHGIGVSSEVLGGSWVPGGIGVELLDSGNISKNPEKTQRFEVSEVSSPCIWDDICWGWGS